MVAYGTFTPRHGTISRPPGGAETPSIPGASPTIGTSTFMEPSKRCTKCSRELPLASFAKSPVGAGGLRAECKACRAIGDREYLLQRRFGISALDYDALLVGQGSRCALCGNTSPGGRWPRFHVDHDHDTGRVRGLLCWSCNTALGALGDSPAALLRAYEYVAGKESTDG